MRKIAALSLAVLSCSSSGTFSPEKSSITASPTLVVADGSAASTLTVVARDTNGAIMPSTAVTVSVTGTATLKATSGMTGSDGSVAFTLVSTTAGSNTLSASVGGVAFATPAVVVFTAASAAALAFRVQPSSAQDHHVIVPAIVVEGRDTFGNQSSFAGDITVALTNPGGAVLSGTTTVTAIDGAATFSDLSISKPGSYTLLATANGLSAANSMMFTVTSGAPSRLVFTALPQSAAAGANLGTVSVAVNDADGNVDPSSSATITLALATAPPGATLAGTPVKAAVMGVATFSDLSLARSGTYTIAATATGLAGTTSNELTISVGPAHHLSFVAPFSTVEVRMPFGAQVAVKDALENTVTSSTASITLAPVAATQSAVAGLATFSALTVNDEGPVTMTASSSGLISATASPFTVTDTTPPSTPSLTVTDKTNVSVTLSWIEVGDDGALGQATSQELRWSTSAITLANFAQATSTVTPAVAASGTPQSAEVDGLMSGVPVFFALRVTDSAGNTSLGVTTATTNACPTGFTGAACDQCATGFYLADAGVCSTYCAPDPCNPPPLDACQLNVAVVYPKPRSCTPTTLTPFYTCASPVQTDCSDAGATCINAACRAVTAPGAGDLMFSEVMATSALGTVGQWVEVVNVSQNIIDLSGVKLETVGTGATSFTVPATMLTVLPGHAFVFGASTDSTANGGAAVDVAWTSMDLSSPKHVKLSLNGVAIDEVDYGSLPLSPPADTAVQVSSAALARGGDQQSWYWCLATSALSGGGYGTPGATNGSCGLTITPPIDYCILQFPKTLGSLTAPASATVYGRFYEPSVTDLNPNGNDNYPLVFGEVGWGRPDAGVASWSWATGGFAGASVGSDPYTIEEELPATFAPTTSGDWAYGWRFRLLNPTTGAPSANQYCDQNGVVADLAAATWGTATLLGGSGDIAAVRASPDGTGLSLPIGGARVTYTKPTIGAERRRLLPARTTSPVPRSSWRSTPRH